MESFSVGTIIAVFEEMFGFWLFWGLVALAAAITVAFLYVLVRDRRLKSGRLVRSQLWAPIGAVAAVALVMMVTNSGLGDLGGPIDWLVVLGVAILGGVGFGILVYVIQGLLSPPRDHTGAAPR